MNVYKILIGILVVSGVLLIIALCTSCQGPLKTSNYNLTKHTRSPFRSTYIVANDTMKWDYLSRVQAEAIIFYGRFPKDKK